MRPLKVLAILFLLFFGLDRLTRAEAAEPRFSVVVEGKGPDVILIPGLSSPRSVWDRTAERLKATHRVHVVQVGGFAGEKVGGNAEGLVVAPLVESLAAYIADNKLKAPAVIGHSLGGEAALMLAARHPGSVGRVMAVDALPFYGLLFGATASAESVKPQADAFRDMILGQTPEQARQGQVAVMQRLVKTEGARAGLVEAGALSDKSVAARALHELMTTDLRPELARIAVPLTVLYAWDGATGVPSEVPDTLFKSAYADAPAAHLERIDGSYHFIMIDQPDAFAAAVDRFLR